MAPAPAPWAVLGDALWCLGLGCLLAAARDALRLALGEGKLRCFLRDAAFSPQRRCSSVALRPGPAQADWPAGT